MRYSPGLAGAEVPETATISVEYPEDYLAVFTLGYKAMRYNSYNDQVKQFHGNQARLDVGRVGIAEDHGVRHHVSGR